MTGRDFAKKKWIQRLWCQNRVAGSGSGYRFNPISCLSLAGFGSRSRFTWRICLQSAVWAVRRSDTTYISAGNMQRRLAVLQHTNDFLHVRYPSRPSLHRGEVESLKCSRLPRFLLSSSVVYIPPHQTRRRSASLSARSLGEGKPSMKLYRKQGNLLLTITSACREYWRRQLQKEQNAI